MTKLSLGIAALAFGLFFGTTPAHAEEGIMPISETAPETEVTNCIGSPDTNCGEVIEGTIDEPADDFQLSPNDEDDTENPETPDDQGERNPTDKDVEANDCTDEESTDCDTPEPTETWPMYLSLGALGLVLIVFVILNLFGGKKK